MIWKTSSAEDHRNGESLSSVLSSHPVARHEYALVFTSEGMANSVRIRMDGKFSHRQETVEEVTDFYGAGKTRALMLAAEDVQRAAEAVEDVLAREDLTTEQRREIAAAFDRVSGFDVDAGLDEPSVVTQN